MATDPFRTRMSNNVCAETDRFAEVASHAESVVDDEGNACFMCRGSDASEIWDIELRVSDCLDVNCASIFIDRFLDVLGI
jgi:hypothetical protein